MKMSRKIMCLLGSSLLIVALAGCGTTERTQPQDSQQEDQQPGDEQGDKDGGGVALGVCLAAGQVGQQILLFGHLVSLLSVNAKNNAV